MISRLNFWLQSWQIRQESATSLCPHNEVTRYIAGVRPIPTIRRWHQAHRSMLLFHGTPQAYPGSAPWAYQSLVNKPRQP